MGSQDKGFANCYCSYIGIACEHVFVLGFFFSTSLPNLSHGLQATGNLEEASDFQEAPEPCLGGSLRVNVSCPILIRKYFRGIGSTWRNKILVKRLPSEN